MRLSGNVRQIATVTLVCSALIAAGYAPALANNNNDYHHKHWYSYFYDQVESLARSLANLGSRVTGRLDYLSRRVDELAATVAGQANASLAARIEQVASEAKNDVALLSATLDQKVTYLDAKIETKFTTLSQGLTSVNASITSLTTDLNGKLEGLAGRVAKLEGGGGPAGGLSVVDAGGAKLGEFVGFDPLFTPLVGMSAQSHSYVLRVADGNLRGDLVFFAGTDCSGQAYLVPIAEDGARKKAVSPAGVKKDNQVYTVYVANPDVAPTEFPVQSMARLQGGGCDTFVEPIGSGPVFVSVVELQLPDAGPYSVK